MPRRNFSEIVLRRFVKSDVELLSKNASILIFIDERGMILSRKENSNEMGILAVIGPSNFGELHFREAPLLEIGIWRGRPYHDVATQKTRIRDRKKRFYLSDSQYVGIKNDLFSLLAELVKKRSQNWSLREWRINLKNDKFLKSRRKFVERGKQIVVPLGVRFSVSQKDTQIFCDICRADLRNPLIREKLIRHGQKLDLIFSSCGTDHNGYKKERYSEKFFRSIGNSHTFSGVCRMLEEEKLTPHQLWFVIKNMKRSELAKNTFSFVNNIPLKNLEEKFEEIEKSMQSVNGIDGINLRTISGRTVKRDFLVFEIAVPELEKTESSAPF